MAVLDMLWAKRDAGGGWHSLVDHSADVSAVLRELLALPVKRVCLQSLGQITDPDMAIVVDRLCALAFLHDVGNPDDMTFPALDVTSRRGTPRRDSRC